MPGGRPRPARASAASTSSSDPNAVSRISAVGRDSAAAADAANRAGAEQTVHPFVQQLMQRRRHGERVAGRRQGRAPRERARDLEGEERIAFGCLGKPDEQRSRELEANPRLDELVQGSERERPEDQVFEALLARAHAARSTGRPGPATGRCATTIPTRGGSRRATNSRARRDARSSHCASSITITSGSRPLRIVTTVRSALAVVRGSAGASASRRSSATSRACRWGAGNASLTASKVPADEVA